MKRAHVCMERGMKRGSGVWIERGMKRVHVCMDRGMKRGSGV